MAHHRHADMNDPNLEVSYPGVFLRQMPTFRGFNSPCLLASLSLLAFLKLKQKYDLKLFSHKWLFSSSYMWEPTHSSWRVEVRRPSRDLGEGGAGRLSGCPARRIILTPQLGVRWLMRSAAALIRDFVPRSFWNVTALFLPCFPGPR